METEIIPGLRLVPMVETDYAYVRKCIEETILSSVPEEERRLSEYWIEDILSISIDHIRQRKMNDELLVLKDKDDNDMGMLWLGLSMDQFTCDTTGYLLGIFVDWNLREQGVGSLMIHYAEDWCRKRGCFTMTVNVGVENKDAMRFYDSHGFETQTVIKRKSLT